MTGEETFGNLHEVLRNLYDEMMPLCSDITGVATGVAALGALFYVASRVWQALSRAEPIDIYPLFRPFCLGACIMFFPTFVLGTHQRHHESCGHRLPRYHGRPDAEHTGVFREAAEAGIRGDDEESGNGVSGRQRRI